MLNQPSTRRTVTFKTTIGCVIALLSGVALHERSSRILSASEQREYCLIGSRCSLHVRSWLVGRSANHSAGACMGGAARDRADRQMVSSDSVCRRDSRLSLIRVGDLVTWSTPGTLAAIPAGLEPHRCRAEPWPVVLIR